VHHAGARGSPELLPDQGEALLQVAQDVYQALCIVANAI
jgi:hypothetical protein